MKQTRKFPDKEAYRHAHQHIRTRLRGLRERRTTGGSGHHVIGVDVNAEKVTMINAGISPIVEPGLDELLAAMVVTGRLRATGSSAEAIDGSDVR